MPVSHPSDQSAILSEVAGLDGEAMRGTDSAALATTLGDVKTTVEAIPTTAMRGTDGAALASSYTVTRAGYIDELGPTNIPADIGEILIEQEHLSAIFPEATNETVTLTAGGTNNTVGAWAEIVDNNAVTLSSKAATQSMHISSMQVEDTNTDDVVYLVEVAYGAAKTVVNRSRFYSGTRFISPVSQIRFRPLEIPAGETVYYRMACETASATCVVSFRYHTHG